MTTDTDTIVGEWEEIDAIGLHSALPGQSIFEIGFPEQTATGTYDLTAGPNINALASGNPMDQNENGTTGEAGDEYVGSFMLVPPPPPVVTSDFLVVGSTSSGGVTAERQRSTSRRLATAAAWLRQQVGSVTPTGASSSPLGNTDDVEDIISQLRGR